MKSVLILSTYPIHNPLHGGQIRLSEITKAYQRAGFTTYPVAITWSGDFSESNLKYSDFEIKTKPKQSDFNISPQIPFIDDLLIYYALQKENNIYQHLFNFCTKHNITHIHFEQPWTTPLAIKLNKSLFNKVTTIYGSENVEHALKQKLLLRYKINNNYDLRAIEETVLLIKNIEIEALNFADLILFVTVKDKLWAETVSSKKTDSLVIPNGVRRLQYDIQSKNQIFSQAKTENWIAFVASAHPPNFHGFSDMIGDSLACVPPNYKFITAGSVGDHVAQILYDSPMKILNQSRFVNLGSNLKQPIIDTLLTNSKLIVLPISYGEGSNLKTPEALVSRNSIVGTSVAFRGYENYINQPNIRISNTKTEFRKSIIDLITNRVYFKVPVESEITNLYWTNTTKSLVEYFK